MNKTSHNPQPAVLYARVSSKDREREGFSIPAQLKLLKDYAGAKSFKVLQEFVDVETAKQSGREGFGQMVALLKRHRSCRIILVEKTDRLYRNFPDWVKLDELNVEIHLVKEGEILSRESRSSAKFMHGIRLLMAKNYIDNLSEETRKGMLEKAAQGIWPSYAPLGYRNVVGPNGKKCIEPDPELAPLVTQLYDWYAADRYSLQELADLAREVGLTYRKTGKPIPKSEVHKILRNLIYAGDFIWDGKTYLGVHQPLVSRQVWEQAQTILDGRFGKRNRRTKHEFAFSGIVQCGHCGCAMVGEVKKASYVYYHCTGYKGKCPEPYTREEVLAQKFGELLKGLAFDGEVLEWMRAALRQSHEDEKRFHDEAIGRLHGEYNRLQARIDVMYVDKLDGIVNATFFDRKAAEWRAEQDRITRAIKEHQIANENYLEEGVHLLELARRAHELFEKQHPQEKRRLLNFVLSNSTWKDGELVAEFRQPFDMLYVANQTSAAVEAKAVGSGADFENWLPGMDSNHNYHKPSGMCNLQIL